MLYIDTHILHRCTRIYYIDTYALFHHHKKSGVEHGTCFKIGSHFPFLGFSFDFCFGYAIWRCGVPQIWQTRRCHGMETFSALLALCEGEPPVTGGFSSQRASDAGFDVSLNRRLNNNRVAWFETQWRSLWRKSKWHALVDYKYKTI